MLILLEDSCLMEVEMITEFTPGFSFLGGMLIGLSAVILMAANGRIAGISGILGGLFSFDLSGALWRIAFLTGLILSPYMYRKLTGEISEFAITGDFVLLVVGGLLVGFGTVVGSGCTSGHGVCGLARLSKRSLVAVCLFMTSAMITVFVMRHVV